MLPRHRSYAMHLERLARAEALGRIQSLRAFRRAWDLGTRVHWKLVLLVLLAGIQGVFCPLGAPFEGSARLKIASRRPLGAPPGLLMGLWDLLGEAEGHLGGLDGSRSLLGALLEASGALQKHS